MITENYLFPGYPILQDDRFFKLSQDSVLLSAFAKIKKGERFIDLGAGIGVLTALTLLRCPGSTACALEITGGAALLAQENMSMLKLDSRCEVKQGDFRLAESADAGAFDCAVSNPPYFSPKRGFSSQSDELASARNESTGDVFDVCACASRALKWGGRLYICYKPDRMGELFSALSQSRLEPKRLRLVHQNQDKPAVLALLEARKGGGKHMAVEPPLLLEKDGQKSPELIKIYTLNEDEL